MLAEAGAPTSGLPDRVARDPGLGRHPVDPAPQRAEEANPVRSAGADSPGLSEIYVEAGSADAGLAMNISAAVVSFTVTAGATSLALRLLRQALQRWRRESAGAAR